jgi:glycosyltransferase involved in cell wall biosynthesis
MAKVDVVVPCYNYGRFLEGCVRSVLEQSITDVRVLVIDDASSDDTLAVATRLAEEDPRVSVISHAQNCGHIRTYNEGITWASADYFLLLSADDLLLPGALKRATMIMDENSDIVLTHGNCIKWNDELPFPDCTTPQSQKWERQDLIKEMCTRGDLAVYDATAIVRTSVQKKIGGYLESLPHCADLEIWLRFAAHGAVAYITATQAIYRKHASAMTNSYCFTVVGCQQRRQAFDTFFESYGGNLPDFRRLRAQAQKKVAKLTFREGIDHLRRGRITNGLQLLYLAIDQDPQLKFFPPFWWLFRFPGPEGRRWAASIAKRATIGLVRGV